MTAQVTSPPFHLDIRVAQSPIVGMRFLLDGRAGDLTGLTATLGGFVEDALAHRAHIRARLRKNEARRHLGMQMLAGGDTGDLADAFGEGLELCAELGAVDERIAGLRLRMDGLNNESIALREISDALATTERGGALTFDEDAARVSRAVRQLHRLVEEDRDNIVDGVTEGSLNHLADAVSSIEVAGKLVHEGAPRSAAQELVNCKDSVSAARSDIERMVRELRPPILAGGLTTALRELARSLDDGVGRFHVFGAPREISAAAELTILRIAQEAAANAVRHSHPTRVDIILSWSRERTVLVVRDDGEGFDPAATEARLGRTRSCGLIAMRQRADLEGAAFEIRSLVGAGTEVRATFR